MKLSGYSIQLRDATITWRSRRQWSVATSPCEAEYITPAMMMNHRLWLKHGTQELLKICIPTALLCDSNATIDVAYHVKLSNRSKHLDVPYHLTRELIDKGNVFIIYLPSEGNLAGIYTTEMTRNVNAHLCSKYFDQSEKWY
jgi:hypothetical protein